MTTTMPILLDCDPGIDDALAILTAAHHSDLVGITTVNGNVGLEHTTRNALVTTQIAGLQVPVHRGADRPLVAPVLDAARIHGPTGLGSVELPALEVDVASNDAAGFICDAARSTDGLHLVAVGPLTNVALALRRDPDLPRHLAGITIMGGSTHTGNVTAAAEFNIWADPEAAAAVFRDAAPVTMVGLDVTLKLVFAQPEVQRIRAAGTATARFASSMLEFYVARSQELGRPGASVHDACAVMAAIRPDLFDRSRHPIEIELSGRHTRGMTVVDRRAHSSGPVEADIVWSADQQTVIDSVLEAATAF